MTKDAATSERYALMRDLLEEMRPADKVILDLGAGKNPLSEMISCRQRIRLDVFSTKDPTIVCNFVEGIPLRAECVDIVIAGEILEHVTRARLFLQEIRRVLRPGGGLVLSVPNIVSLKYRIAFMLGRIPALAAKADYTYLDDPYGHVRDYSFGEMRHVLHDQGFLVIAERGSGVYLPNGRRMIPPAFIPRSFSDNVIVAALRRG